MFCGPNFVEDTVRDAIIARQCRASDGGILREKIEEENGLILP